ncbi:MAG: helix-turn-helix domain-containing protein [Acidimicrobiia bacterium]
MIAAELLRTVRQEAGLSTRALAERAGTSASTVSRIEAGAMDPTVGMLSRLCLAANAELALGVQPVADPWPTLAQLHDAWRRTSSGDEPDWPRFRALLDFLDMHPERVAAAIAPCPSRSGSREIDVLLAAVADKLADDHGLSRPLWSANVGALPEPTFAQGTARMQTRMRAATPTQLRVRNLVIDATSLWRHG